MIHVIATITVQDGKLDEFIKIFTALVPDVHAEDGCIEYGPTVDVETNIDAQIPLRTNVATIIEKWESLEALEKHLIAPHMLTFRDKVKDIVEEVTLQIAQPAS